MGTAALGLALHFLIAITTAVVYYLVALRWPLLWRQPVLSGAIYGLLVYGVMNYIVLPMSAAGSGSKDPLWIGLSILVHMFLIGGAPRRVRPARRPGKTIRIMSPVRGRQVSISWGLARQCGKTRRSHSIKEMIMPQLVTYLTFDNAGRV